MDPGSGQPPLARRIAYWAPLLARFFWLQAAAQLLAIASGLLIVRGLAVEEYAVYTMAIAVQTTMAILADGGITQSLLARGGRVASDRVLFSRVVRTALGLRRRLEIGTIVIGLPLLLMILRAHGVGWISCAIAAGAVAVAMHGTVIQTVYSTVMFLQLRPMEAQRAAVISGAVRLAMTIAALLLVPRSVVFLWIGGGALLLQGTLTERAASPHLEESDELSVEDRRMMLVAFKSQVLNGIYFALQPQITVWILTIFGTVETVAQVGALGRLAVALSLVSSAFSSLALPRFARHRDLAQVRRWYGLLVSGMAGIGVSIVIGALLFPHAILAVLGSQYRGLDRELVWIVGATAVSLVSAASYLLNSARGWVRGIWLGVPATLASQILLAMYVDLGSVRGAVLMQASASAAPLAINLAIGVLNMRRSAWLRAASAPLQADHAS
jgi:O-antigen/teichoic acid export membrane protein